MFGFIIGTVCLVALIATIKRARYGYWGHHYGGGCGHRGWGGGWQRHGGPPWARGGWDDHGPDFGQRDQGHDHGHGHGRGWGGGFVMRFLSERLDASPAQEKVIAQAIDEMREAIGKAREGFKASRGDVASAVRSDNFDVSHVGALFSKHDDAIDGVRKAFVSAMQKVHDALDERQRKVLADIIESGPGFFGGGRGGGGPWGAYRGGW
jgi:Spy/CpxP family protein refolding chaperone